jgi:NAD(P)-dependent dehydrogenase (short-subunit alcohol dehydrogenase family)
MRTALVTGANRGIGLEVARQLAAAGLRVLLAARDRSKAANAARDLTGQVHPLELDVTSTESIAAAAHEVTRTFGGVDVLVNNAAILVAESGAVLNIAIDNFRRTLETNVLGAIAVSQAFVPGMLQRRYGRVVNVSSEAGQLTSMNIYAPAYSISKSALNAFTRQLAAAVNRRGVLVNSASPGWVRTDMGGPAAPRSVAEGADTIVWLATLDDRGPNGGFFSDRQPIGW